MRLRTVKLSDLETVDNKGTKEVRRVNEEEVGLILNNRALRYGFNNGLIGTTNLGEILGKLTEDIELAWSILYLGAIGANKGFEDRVTRDEFVDRLEVDPQEVAYCSQTLILPKIPDTYEEFEKELKAKTEKNSEKK